MLGFVEGICRFDITVAAGRRRPPPSAVHWRCGWAAFRALPPAAGAECSRVVGSTRRVAVQRDPQRGGHGLGILEKRLSLQVGAAFRDALTSRARLMPFPVKSARKSRNATSHNHGRTAASGVPSIAG